MALQVFLAGNLRKYIDAYNAQKGLDVAIKAGTTIRDLIQMLHIPEDETKLVTVNGKGAPLETVLEGDERLAFFPPLGGG